MKLILQAESFPLAQVFSISRGSRSVAQVLTVELHHDGAVGRAECVPYPHYGESLDSVTHQVRHHISQLPTAKPAQLREIVNHDMPPGAARNAVDCALWDLEAKHSGTPAWKLAGLAEPRPVTTAYTISLDQPEKMRASAVENAHRPVLKVKLGGEMDLERLSAVRAGAPAARLIVDANESWSAETYRELGPALLDLGIEMLEQPLPAGADDALPALPRPVPVCADESCHTRADLRDLKGRYDYINIKLDKTGGLTEALALRQEARQAGFGVMVGCMLGSSLAMAPAHLVAQGVELVDLDGPLWLARDRAHALSCDDAGLHPPAPQLWG